MSRIDYISQEAQDVFDSIPNGKWIKRSDVLRKLRPRYKAADISRSFYELEDAGLIHLWVASPENGPGRPATFIAARMAGAEPPKWDASMGKPIKQSAHQPAFERIATALEQLVEAVQTSCQLQEETMQMLGSLNERLGEISEALEK